MQLSRRTCRDGHHALAGQGAANLLHLRHSTGVGESTAAVTTRFCLQAN